MFASPYQGPVWENFLPGKMVLLIITALYVSWRLWRFTLVPLLWQNEPRSLPYWIPIYGQTYEFLFSPARVLEKASNYFEPNEPCAISLGGKNFVILRNVKDIATIWKETTIFHFDPFVEDVLKAFGFSRIAVHKMFCNPQNEVSKEYEANSRLIKKNPQNKHYIGLQSDWFVEELIQRDRLADLTRTLKVQLHNAMQIQNFSEKVLVISEPAKKSKTVSLQKFVREILVHCTMNTFFNEEISKIAPSFIGNYQKFEDDNYKIFFGYPRIFARSLHVAIDQALDELEDFLTLAYDQRKGLSPIFKTIESELAALGVPRRDIARNFILILWASTLNAHRIAFWILAHALCDKSLLMSLRSEIDQATNEDGSVNETLLYSQCPLLDSVWAEALRFYNNVTVVRKGTSDFVLGNKLIRRGTPILGPFWQFHHSVNYFGNSSGNFIPDRFLRDKSLRRAKGYGPFGGGHTYCPGRRFAQREVYLFISIVLHQFDLELVSPTNKSGEDAGKEVRVPAMNTSVPATAAISPLTDLLVKITPAAAKSSG